MADGCTARENASSRVSGRATDNKGRTTVTDKLQHSLEETGEVLVELVAKARETIQVGGSRRSFFARTAKLAGATALGAAGVGLLQPLAARTALAGSAPTDTTKDILNIAATAEALAVTFYYHALATPALPDVNNNDSRNYFQAAMVQEYVHLEILKSLGGKPLAVGFYFPNGMFSVESVFFPTASTLEDYFISAYLAAAMEFSGAVSTGITKANTVALGLCVQIAGIECEHRALLRDAQGLNPPNNVLIETALLTSVGGAVPALMPFISAGASGYKGPVGLPSMALVDAMAQPFGFSSFPSYTVV
jgi:hypothetical protein